MLPPRPPPRLKVLQRGVRQAIENLQIITGRKFLGEDQRLIIPTNESRGVDIFAATFSAGPAVKTVVVGLLEDVSLESAQRLVRTIYAHVVDTIGSNDERRPEQQIDNIMRLRPVSDTCHWRYRWWGHPFCPALGRNHWSGMLYFAR